MSEPKKKLTLKRKTGAVDAAKSPGKVQIQAGKRDGKSVVTAANVEETVKRDEPLNGLQRARFIVGSPGGRDIIIANQQYLPPERHEEQPPLTAKSNIILAQKGDGPARGN
jgi:hypothetical protein